MKVYLPIADRPKREREHVLELPVPPRREPEPKADQDEPMGGEVILDLFQDDDPFVI
ncbi:MAG: hypothetical protein VX405_11965 [Myxococcota bacterium]|nr:hypothetical protein [Myxococcota bacterium]